jgi:DNA invertase Pin-like site-specific DNA recombinase
MIKSRIDTVQEKKVSFHSKVEQHHLERLAIVYVRQSSPHQVKENRESRQRQYALRESAVRLGWSDERVLTIDEDQGLSGRSSINRPGFQRLLAEVSMNHVGLVLGLELSRLSRSSKDWHHLVDVCSVFNTLLGDQDGIYDSSDGNDRLLLGMKGAMSEFELTTLRNRLQRGRENKAARGELVLQVLVGYYKIPETSEVVLDPDERVRATIALVFSKFEELQSSWRVFRYFVDHHLEIGFRCKRGANIGQVEWRRANARRIYRILKHPMYSGVYTYGLHTQGCAFPAPTELPMLILDQYPSYISWEQYVENQRVLESNRTDSTQPGTSRAGNALLTGLVRCGTCGQRMRTSHRERNRALYLCERSLKETGKITCPGLSSHQLDHLVEEKLLCALEPASLQLSLEAEKSAQEERLGLHRQWEQRIEQAEYESERAARQYQQVEPENRLVARSLESQWESKLLAQQQLQEQFDRYRTTIAKELTEKDIATINATCESIQSLWHSRTTSASDRKEILRCVIESVDVQVKRNSEHVDVTIHWCGGYRSQHEISRAVGRYDQMQDSDKLFALIRTLHSSGMTTQQIAEKLNEEGWQTARQRNPFSKSNLTPLLKQLGLVSELYDPSTLEKGEWIVKHLSEHLGTTTQKLYYWIKHGWVHSRRSPVKNFRIVWADSDE